MALSDAPENTHIFLWSLFNLVCPSWCVILVTVSFNLKLTINF